LDGSTISQEDIIALLTLFNQHQIEVIKTENLYTFDGKIGFSLGQGQ
jgi:isocitrate dehydrogenase